MSVLQGWFALGTCVPILSSLATLKQSMAVMDHIESCWEVLSGEIPLTISYPAKDEMQWQIETGYDPKKTSWSYHHGGILAYRLVLFLFLIILSNLLTSFSVRQSKFSMLCSILDHNLVNPKNLADI